MIVPEVINQSKTSGPMRESELQQKPTIAPQEMESFGLDLKSIDPQLIPQIEQFCFLQRYRSNQEITKPPAAFVQEREEEPEPQQEQPKPSAPVLTYKQARQKKYNNNFKDNIEKERYFTALKALIHEKVEKKKTVVPNLCSCGALAENI